MLAFFTSRADAERRASLVVLASMRWALIVVATFQINFRPGSSQSEYGTLNLLLLGALGLNAVLQWLLATHRAIYLGFPVLLGFYDALAITGAIASVDHFDNPTYLLYYPALLSFVLVFPGKWSVTYTVAIMGLYIAACLPGETLDLGGTGDQKDLALRLSTMATAALTANLVVRVERRRREEAVAAEMERGREVIAMEQRAIEAERRAQGERHRLSQEVHDGVSQNVYMLTLGLETAAEAVAREPGTERLAERMQALVRLSRQALMETRHLLYDLDRVMTGESSFVALVQHQAREFSAVSGIPVEVRVEGTERTLDAAAVGELFRVVQEALSNVMRHSGASTVTLDLRYGQGDVGLSLRDDGHGFQPTVLGGGHGLGNMRERIERLGGELTVDSAPESGTTVALRVPYGARAHAEDSRPAG